MSAATLKKWMGKAGAGLANDHGFDDLHDVLAALAAGGAEQVSSYLATIATGLLGAMVVSQAGKLNSLKAAVGTTGTAGATTVQVLVNGVSKGEVTVDNTDDDGTVATDDELGIDLAAGDVVQLNVSAAPTAGADLVATARISSVVVE